jgi:hypothetical protein
MVYIVTDEEYDDLITSYDFLSKVMFTHTEQVKMAIDYCQVRDRLTEDTLNFLLDKLSQLELTKSINNELETTNSNQDWEVTGTSAN